MQEFQKRYAGMKNWVQAAHSAGWLNETDIETLASLETESADDLFKKGELRPLVVGLFGGTGSGKSSLLNRLAGETLAAVGVERPTSRRATLYLHQSQAVTTLPQESPVMDTDIKYHTATNKRQIAWLDMPDIDSVEQSNRRLVMAWLPYIDWLIYVTTPERYRDDVGWEIIQRRKNRHHWLFVVNRWDEAQDAQLGEFRSDLQQAGFVDPVVLRTSCIGEIEDDFKELEKTIEQAIEQHGLDELKRIGIVAKLEELDAVESVYMGKIGNEEQWTRLSKEILGIADQRLQLFQARLNTEIEGVAQHYPEAPALWQKDRRLPHFKQPDLEQLIWSSYCDHLLADTAADAAVRVEQEGISTRPLFLAFRHSLSSAKKIILGRLGDGLKQALASPEVPMQRVLRKAMRFMTYALPAGIGLWVAYNVVNRYLQGLTGDEPFLGINFLLHSVLLIGLAWFIPFLLFRWLRPSLRDAARAGLRYGLNQALDTISSDLGEALTNLEQKRLALVNTERVAAGRRVSPDQDVPSAHKV